jgi:hypothetical protein
MTLVKVHSSFRQRSRSSISGWAATSGPEKSGPARAEITKALANRFCIAGSLKQSL